MALTTAQLYHNIASTIMRNGVESEIQHHLEVTEEHVTTQAYVHREMYIEHVLMPLLKHYTAPTTLTLVRRHLKCNYYQLYRSYKLHIEQMAVVDAYETISAMCAFTARQHVVSPKLVHVVGKYMAVIIQEYFPVAMQYRELLVDFLCMFTGSNNDVFAAVTPVVARLCYSTDFSGVLSTPYKDKLTQLRQRYLAPIPQPTADDYEQGCEMLVESLLHNMDYEVAEKAYDFIAKYHRPTEKLLLHSIIARVFTSFYGMLQRVIDDFQPWTFDKIVAGILPHINTLPSDRLGSVLMQFTWVFTSEADEPLSTRIVGVTSLMTELGRARINEAAPSFINAARAWAQRLEIRAQPLRLVLGN